MGSYGHDIVGAVGQGQMRRAEAAISTAFSEVQNFCDDRGYDSVIWTILTDVMEEAVRRGFTPEEVHEEFSRLTNDREFVWEKLAEEVARRDRHRRDPIEDPNTEVVGFNGQEPVFRQKTLKEVDKEISALSESEAKSILRQEVRLRREAQKELIRR